MAGLDSRSSTLGNHRTMAIETRVTIRDIAKRLNVSHATVSRALNRPDDPIISEATRTRVIQTAVEMGYRPNTAARALVTGRTGLIALWLWSEGLQDSYQANVTRHAQLVLQEQPYELIVTPVNPRSIEHAKTNRIVPIGVDGIIAHEAGPAIEAVFGKDYQRTVPVVCTGAYNWLPNADRVTIDLTQGALEALRHLVQSGTRRLLYVHNLSDDITSLLAKDDASKDPRQKAVESVAREFNIEVDFLFVRAGRSLARQGIIEHIRQKGCPDAIFGHNDDLAIGVYRGLCDLGIKVPDDVLLAGCDGIEDTEYLEVPLSTIVQPIERVLSLAWELLQQRINNPSLPAREYRFSPPFVLRKSSLRTL